MGSVRAAHIAASSLDADDLLRTVAYAFDIRTEQDDRAALRHSIRQYFEKMVRSGQRALLIIDEAQGLPAAALDELRLLADLHSRSRQMLQLFLIGQEELRERMSDPEMEYFQQRVIANYHLVPLNLMESRDYVEYRLRQAGWQGDPELTGDAVMDIICFSRGVPRHITSYATDCCCSVTGSDATNWTAMMCRPLQRKWMQNNCDRFRCNPETRIRRNSGCPGGAAKLVAGFGNSCEWVATNTATNRASTMGVGCRGE